VRRPLYTRLSSVREALEAGKFTRIWQGLSHMHPARRRVLLEAFAAMSVAAVWERFDSGRAGKVLVHLHVRFAQSGSGNG